jgi:Co/Zn/Cd efflux system component
MAHHSSDNTIRSTARLVAIFNLAYFGIEFYVARKIGSVSLFADSIDFLEDASINILILMTMVWAGTRRAQVGMSLAGILLVPGLATLWMAWHKFNILEAPDATLLSLTGLGALGVNLACAFLWARSRNQGGSLTRAAFLSSRNDAIANIFIIAAGLVTAYLWKSAWPDLIVGLGIAALNFDAAREVWEAAREEQKTAEKSY